MSNLKHRIISANDADDYVEWHEPLVQGKIASDSDIRPPTANQMQNLHKDAYDEGFNMGRKEGRTKGYKEGHEQAIAESSELFQKLESIINVLAEPVTQLDEEMENSIVQLTLSIARQLVRREIKIEPGEIVAVVREAVRALPISARNPTIYLHPEDIQLVRNAFSLGNDEKSYRLEEDLLLTRGDCRVETESSYIDASVEARLSAIAANMLGDERQQDKNNNDDAS
ncbi:MAG: flagellar assembly protein FliH [Proteobacteria bacterium]|nr:flagellar assembly protein FliH [Pseudomonadota bacterium]NOG58939.1 flagellar assembly protein FliH [Pseudomonadota bacterium]